MIAHLCRLAWNRRRTHLLLVGELFLSFLVLTPLVVACALFAAEQLKPLGFQHEGVWSVGLLDQTPPPPLDRGKDREQAIAEAKAEYFAEYQGSIELVGRELRALDQVQAAALANEVPFFLSPVSWNGIPYVHISDEGLEVLRPRLLSGRWFQPEDEALDWTPAVIDQELSRVLFGGEDPLGKVLADSPVFDLDLQEEFDSPTPDRVRVVGVVEDCFYFGQFGLAHVSVQGFIFLRISNQWLADPVSNGCYFLVRSFPGTGPAVGETLTTRIQAVVPRGRTVQVNVESLAAIREADRLFKLQRVRSTARISGLLTLMVALGLTGMTWQNVRRRTREIGIRRAVGAPGGRIYVQFLGELAVLMTVAITLGCVVILQFGLLERLGPTVFWSDLPAHVVAWGLGGTAFALYLLVLLCGLYPSWLAARVRPAEALHHD